MGNRAEAYDFALFEERNAAIDLPSEHAQPQRLPEQEPQQQVVELPHGEPRKKPQAKPKLRPLRMFVAFVCFSGIFLTVLLVVQSQVLLTELTQEINKATTDLDEARSLEIQLNMQAALRMNDAQVEEYATERLGLSKISGTQVTYINVAQLDQGQIFQDIDGGSLLDKLIAAVSALFAS